MTVNVNYKLPKGKDGGKWGSSTLDGFKNIAKLPQNATQAVKNGGRGVKDIYNATANNLTGEKGSDGIFKDIKTDGAKRQTNLDMLYILGQQKETVDNKNGKSKKEVIAAAQTLADDYAKNLQGENGEDVEVIVYDGLYVSDEETKNGVDKSETDGFHESGTRKIYINIDKVENTESLMATVAHEMNHVDDMDRGIAYDGLDGTREDVAHVAGDKMKSFFQDDFGVSADNHVDNQSWLYNQEFSSENSLVNDVDKAEPFQFGKRPLNNFPVVILNPIDDYFNTEIAHEHGFYEDGSGDDIGFGNKGPIKNKENESNGYIFDGIHYNDDIMRKAQEEVEFGKYSIWPWNQNNCQDYSDRLREKYEEIKNKMENNR